MIILADKTKTDGVALKLCEQIKTDLPILLVSRVDNLDFNEEVLQLTGKQYVLINFTELGWSWNFTGHHWGVNTASFDFMNNEGYRRLDEFIATNKPKISFVRELLLEDVTDTVQPISYPCFLPPEPIQTKEQFNNRPFQTIFSWGLSHEYRKDLHAQVWSNAGKHGYSVLDNVHYLAGFLQYESNPKKWMTVNIPWYCRYPMEDFIKINGMAKISVSIAGAGRSCFRHAESPVNAVMLMWDDKTAWHQKDWIHGVNCIKCKQGEEIETILEWLNKPDELYDVYMNGVVTVDRFRFENYVPYLENIINNA